MDLALSTADGAEIEGIFVVTPGDLTFGELLKQYRLAAGLTHEELAERARLSVRGISDLERGRRSRPWPETIALLADGLRLAPSQTTALIVASGRRPEFRSANLPNLALPKDTNNGAATHGKSREA